MNKDRVLVDKDRYYVKKKNIVYNFNAICGTSLTDCLFDIMINDQSIKFYSTQCFFLYFFLTANIDRERINLKQF